MEEKWNVTQKDIEKALKPSKLKKWLTTIGLLVIGFCIVLIIFYFTSNNKKIQDQPIHFEPSVTGTNSGVKKISKETGKKGSQSAVSEDFDYYINSSILNSSNNTSVAITIVDENENISSSISSSIADIYNQTGNNGNTGLLRSSFISKPGFQELFEGNSGIIDKLQLTKYADYIAIGKISYSIRKGTLVDDTYVCTVSLTMNIISTNQKSLAKSFTFSVSGNGATEDQAKEFAIVKLLNKYSSEYSSI